MPEQIVWLSTTQAAERLSCTRSNVVYHIQQGHIEAIRAGAKCWRIREDALISYQANRAEAATDA